MAKVIGFDKTKVRKVTHRTCTAIIEFLQNEVQSKVVHDYGGGSDVIYYIICPNCGKEIQVSSN